MIRTQLGMKIVVRPWPWMAQVMTTAKAGANWFSAVPPMVWSAFRLMAAKPSSSEKIMPVTPATRMAMNIDSCGCAGPKPALVQALQRKAGEQRANDHHALKCDVDDAGMLTEHAAHGDEQQRHWRTKWSY